MCRKILGKIHAEKVDVCAATYPPRVYTSYTRREKERERQRGALITRNGRIFISERGAESSRRAQKNKTIDKKNYEMGKVTVEIIGGTGEPRILLLP